MVWVDPGIGVHSTTVLLVSDEAAERDDIRRLLRNAGFAILEAATAAEARTLIESTPTAVVLDLRLPALAAADLRRTLRASPATAAVPLVRVADADLDGNAGRPEDGAEPSFLLPFPIEPDLLVTVIRTLHALRRTEQQVRTERARLDAIAGTIAVGILLYDAAGVIRFANAAAARVTGVPLDQLLGLSYVEIPWQLRHRDGSPLLPESRTFPRVRDSGRAVTGELLLLRRPDGSEIRVALRSSLLRGPDGAFAGVVSAMNDVSDLDSAREEARRRRQEVATLLDSSPDMIVRVDRDLRLAYVNATVESTTGRRAAELTGQRLSTLGVLAPDALADTVRAVLESGQEQHLSIVVRLGGGERVFLARMSPERDMDGTVASVLVVFTDLTDITRAQERLRSTEQRLQMALRQSRMGVWEWQMDTGEVRWSREVEEIFGLPPGGFAGTFDAYLDHIHPDDQAQLLDAVRQAQEQDERLVVIHRIIRPDGALRWLEGAGGVERDHNGHPVRMVGTVRDITARKEAEAALRASEQLFATLTAIAPVAIFQLDAAGRPTYINARMYQMAGLPATDEPSYSWWNAVHPDDQPVLAGAWRRAIEAGTGFRVEFRFVRPDGQVTWVLGQAQPEQNSEGGVSGWAGTATDITDLRQAEAALREREQLLDQMLESMGDGLILIDGAGLIVRGNEAAAGILGVAREQLPGVRFDTPPWRIFALDGQPLTQPDTFARFRGGDIDRLTNENMIERPDGERRVVEWVTTPLRDATGALTGLVTTLRDITRRTHEEQAQRLLAEAGAMLATSMDYEHHLRDVARTITREVAGYCAVDVISRDGSVRRLIAVHHDPALAWAAAEASQYPPDPATEPPYAQVLHDGRAYLRSPLKPDEPDAERITAERKSLIRRLPPNSVLLMPLVVRGRVMGCFTLHGRPGRLLSETDVPLFQEVARHAALAIENAWLYDEAKTALARADESFAQLDTLFAGAPVGLAFLDRDLRFVRVNERLAAINGHTVEEHTGRSIDELSPGIAAQVTALMQQVLDAGEPLLDIEITGETPGVPGDTRSWSASYYPIRDAAGRVHGIGTVVSDITERRRAAAAQRVLAEAGAALAASLDYAATLRTVARLAVPTLADYCVVDLLHPDGHLRRVTGAHTDPHRDSALGLAVVYPPDLSSLRGVAEAFRTGHTVVYESLTDSDLAGFATSAEHLTLLQQLQPRAVLFVPMTAGGQTLGVLSLVSNRERTFSTVDRQLAEELGARAATAISNARLYQAEQDARARTERLQRLTARLAEALTTEQICAAAVDATLDATGARAAAVALRAGAGVPPRVAYANGAQAEDLNPLLTRLTSGHATAGRGPLWFAHQGADFVQHAGPDDATADGAHPAVLLPLVAGGELFGGLALDFGPGWSFVPEDQSLLEAVADQCAQALARAHAFQVLHQARADAVVSANRANQLYAVTAALSQAVADGDVSGAVIQRVVESLGAYGGSLAQREPDGEFFRVLAKEGLRPEATSAWRRYRFVSGLPLAEAIATGLPVLIGSREEMLARFPVMNMPQLTEYEALVVLPLRVQGRIDTILSLTFEQQAVFTTEDVAFYAAVAQQCEQGLERLRLYSAERSARAEAEAAHRRMSFLAGASAALSASLDYEQTFKSIAELAVPELADWCVIDVLGDEGEQRRVAAQHIDATQLGLLWRIALRSDGSGGPPSPVMQSLLSGRSFLLSHVTEEALAERVPDPAVVARLRGLGFGSLLIVPMPVRDRVVGVIALGAAELGHFARQDLELVEELARRAAVAIDNARLYREAQTALKVRDEFLSSISHDLRNPLSSIRGFAQLLRRRVERLDVSDRNFLVESLMTVENSTGKMTAMIGELLDLARLQDGRPLELHPQPVDMVALVQRVVSEHQPAAQRHTLRLEASQPELIGEWDPVRLERVVENLVGNALKYSPRGGDILIEVQQEQQGEQSCAVLRVRDQGIGIPAADLPRIFQRFHRATNVGNISGTGIGLAGSKQIAEQHGGSMDLTSIEGEGTTVILRLPLVPPVATLIPDSDAPEPAK